MSLRGLAWTAMVRLAPKPWFIVLMRKVVVPADRTLLRRSTGRVSVVGTTTGAGTLLLTTTGRRTGRRWATPLFFGRQDNAYVVVASNFGRTSEPAWSENLVADPRATVTVGQQVVAVTARLLTGAEHEKTWEQIVALGPAYRNYLESSGRPAFRIFALEPGERE